MVKKFSSFNEVAMFVPPPFIAVLTNAAVTFAIDSVCMKLVYSIYRMIGEIGPELCPLSHFFLLLVIPTYKLKFHDYLFEPLIH